MLMCQSSKFRPLAAPNLEAVKRIAFRFGHRTFVVQSHSAEIAYGVSPPFLRPYSRACETI
jgi:hypothetical protein